MSICAPSQQQQPRASSNNSPTPPTAPPNTPRLGEKLEAYAPREVRRIIVGPLRNALRDRCQHHHHPALMARPARTREFLNRTFRFFGGLKAKGPRGKPLGLPVIFSSRAFPLCRTVTLLAPPTGGLFKIVDNARIDGQACRAIIKRAH